MAIPRPHFLLFSEASGPEANDHQGKGRWRFLLENLENQRIIEATDREAESSPQRLDLLALVRGLEALPEPARVTVCTRSRYISHGLRFGLELWRESDWNWERNGRKCPVRNRDLWQRVERALKFHRVTCRLWRLDPAEEQADASVCDNAHAGEVPAKPRPEGVPCSTPVTPRQVGEPTADGRPHREEQMVERRAITAPRKRPAPARGLRRRGLIGRARAALQTAVSLLM